MLLRMSKLKNLHKSINFYMRIQISREKKYICGASTFKKGANTKKKNKRKGTRDNFLCIKKIFLAFKMARND